MVVALPRKVAETALNQQVIDARQQVVRPLLVLVQGVRGRDVPDPVVLLLQVDAH